MVLYRSKSRLGEGNKHDTRCCGQVVPSLCRLQVSISLDTRMKYFCFDCRARFDNAGAHRHYSRSYERIFASDEARMGATSKAESIKEGLPLSHPSFVKPMLQSHVTGGFWLVRAS